MRCHLCKYFCESSLRTLIHHWRTFHSLNETSAYKCTLYKCARKFSSLNSFKRHFRLDHKNYFEMTSITIPSTINPNEVESENDNGSVQINTSPCISFDNNHEMNDLVVPSSSTNTFESTDSFSCIPVENEFHELHNLPSPGSSNITFEDLRFPEIIELQMQRMITDFYSKPSIPRNVVQYVINEIRNILTGPLEIVQNRIKEILIENNVPVAQQNEINSMFRVFNSELDDVRSEYLRFKKLKKLGILIHPISKKIGEEFENKNGIEKPKNRYEQIVPLRQLFKAFLETGNTLDCIINYMDSLSTSSTVMSNIMQGKVWKDNIKNLTGKICMPMYMFFDAYETGNSLGSHSGIHYLGAVYVSLHCIPPEYRSCLQNMFLAMLFHYDDLKKYGNKVVFSTLIDEFNYLTDKGIEIETSSKKLHVYFILTVIEGDNLGLNVLLGYSESFSAKFYCRFCKVFKYQAQYSTVQDNSAWRTETVYVNDVRSNSFKTTGIKENCAFNNVRHFHCTQNLIADLMHDLPEGIIPLEAGLIFHQLILIDKLIDYHIFNSILRNFNYQFESNKPPVISIDHLKNKVIKMSAVEMVNFITYAPIMFGRFVPETNEY